MLTMIRSDTSRSDLFCDLFSQASGELNSFDQLSCSFHPGFRLQVFCPEESIQPALLCVKCMLDPETEKRIKMDSLVAIQDVINRISALNDLEAQAQIERDSLKKTMFDFTSKDHFGSFDRHVDAQMKKLHREIEKTKESLDELEAQFRKVFEKQQKFLRSKEEELKKRINEYVVDQEQLKQFLNLTPQQIMETIKKITSLREYEKLIRTLYQRETIDQQVIQTAMINGIVEVMDDVKEKVNKLKNYKIQTTLLEEIRQKLASIEVLDQCFQGVEELDTKLMGTLEKVRDANERIKHSETLKTQKSDPLESLKERLANFQPKASDLMECEPTLIIESTSRGGSPAKKEPVNGHHNAKRTEEKLPSRANEGIEIVDQGFGLDNNFGSTHRRQKIDAESYKKIEMKKSERVEIILDDDEEEAPPKKDAAEQGLQEEVQVAEQQGDLVVEQEKIVVEKTNNDQTLEGEVFNNVAAVPEENGIELENQDHNKAVEEVHIEQEQLQIPQENDENNKLDESLVSPEVELFGFSEDEEAPELDSGEQAKTLHDWIDRKLTGYVVFLNTEQKQVENSFQEKWKNLDKADREQYRNIAQKAREELKNEYQDIEEGSSEFADLQKIIEEKIKEVIKE